MSITLGQDNYGVDLTPADLEFTSGDVSAITGVGVTKLDYWYKTGLVRPSVFDPRRKRNKWFRNIYNARLYSLADVLVVDLISELRHQHGMSLQGIRRALVRLEQTHGIVDALYQALDPMSSVVLVVAKGDVLYRDEADREAWSVLAEPGQRIMLSDRCKHLGQRAIEHYLETVTIVREIHEPSYQERIAARQLSA